ncbi:hypothetical protein V8F20_005226 [Naviculisporaceae sp. PSN 640]
MIGRIHKKLDGMGSSTYLSPRAIDLTCLGAGVFGVIVTLCTFAAPVFLPPIPPSWDAERTTQYYRDHHSAVQFSAIGAVIGGTCYSLSTAIFASYIARIPNISRTNVYVQLGTGICNSLIFVLGGIVLATLDYRLDRNPEITQALSDFFWITWMFPTPVLQAQVMSLAWAALSDRRSKRECAFPRWLGVFNILFCIAAIPVYALHTVYEGPLAWNGAISFWFIVGGWGFMSAVEYYSMFGKIWSGSVSGVTDVDLESTETSHV